MSKISTANQFLFELTNSAFQDCNKCSITVKMQPLSCVHRSVMIRDPLICCVHCNFSLLVHGTVCNDFSIFSSFIPLALSVPSLASSREGFGGNSSPWSILATVLLKVDISGCSWQGLQQSSARDSGTVRLLHGKN